jgi:8-oxo-dGTP pyrophosphatase MutT (NUDIX family)
MASAHRGTGVIVTNPGHTRFVVQRKDATYPRFPRGYSLFGGACEAGESAIEALVRELFEELGPARAQLLVAAGLHERGVHRLGPQGFAFTLFEACIDDVELDRIAREPVYEGECAAVIDRDALEGLSWVWDLGVVITDYLRRHASTR